jgi:rod shape-determining protein MreB
MAIGLKTAEQIKINVGAVTTKIQDVPEPIMVKGKDLMEGIPVTRKIDHSEVAFILEKSFSSIEHAILQTLEICPPELAADIYQNGLHVTGGNAFLRGIKERLELKVKLPVHIDEDALISVSKGAAQMLRDTKKYKSILFD